MTNPTTAKRDQRKPRNPDPTSLTIHQVGPAGPHHERIRVVDPPGRRQGRHSAYPPREAEANSDVVGRRVQGPDGQALDAAAPCDDRDVHETLRRGRQGGARPPGRPRFRRPGRSSAGQRLGRSQAASPTGSSARRRERSEAIRRIVPVLRCERHPLLRRRRSSARYPGPGECRHPHERRLAQPEDVDLL